MKRLFLKVCFGVLFAAACANAQDTAKDPKDPNIVEKLVQVKHVEPNQQLRNLFDVLGVRMSDSVGGYIALKGSKDAVAAAEETLHRMDVEKPPEDVELTGWLVMAPSHGTDGSDLPAELMPVAKQLKSAFGYADLRLLTSFVLRTRAGGSGDSGGPIGGDFYNFSASRVDVSGETAGAHKLRLTAVHLSCNKSNLLTDVDLSEGQKVVIAKTSMLYAIRNRDLSRFDAPESTPLILVLSAHVLAE
jgi:hypothetical protein